MNNILLDNLVKFLQFNYQQITGQSHPKKATPEQLVQHIINYYGDIINCMPGNVYWLSTKGVALGCNKNVLEMFGLKSIKEFKGLTFEDMDRIGKWGPEATASFKKDTLDVVRTATPKLNIEEPPIPHQDGRIIYFLTSRVPLFDEARHVIGVVGISIDITDLRNAQKALQIAKEDAENANLSKSDFIANMSHDIKTPLAGMIGTAELLSYRLKTEENKELALNIKLCGQQLLNLFENCLEIFKLESNNMNLPEQSFNLKKEIEAILSIFNHLFATKNLSLDLDISPDLPELLHGSRAGLQRILINLIGNAIKFTNKGQINIAVSCQENIFQNQYIIKFMITDTGIGIPKNKQKIIFERFTRLNPSYKGTYEGSGIGLYVVNQIVKAMNGKIELTSKLHKGSQFIIELPFKKTFETYNENQEPLHEPSSGLTNIKNSFKNKSVEPPLPSLFRVLMVEDNPAVQRMQSTLLSSLNCFVEIADSGEKALDLFEVGKYDLILMDLGLPTIQGDLTARLIRKIEYGFSIRAPIIALTAHVDNDTQQLCEQSGINDCYNKPISLEQATNILQKYCKPNN